MARDQDVAAIIKAFSAIPKAARRAIRPAIDKGADEIVRRMKYLVPVDDEDGGQLRDSIAKTNLSALAVRVTAGNESTTRDTARGPFDYSKAVEFGTADMPSQAYFVPTVNTLKKRVRARIDRAISKAVKHTWEKT